MTAAAWGQIIAALGGGSIAIVVVKLLEVLAGRRSVVVTADVALSTESRAWVEQFRKAMEEQAARHTADTAALQAQIDRQGRDIASLQGRLTERETRIRTLEGENAKLEGEVKRLTARVRALEGGSK